MSTENTTKKPRAKRKRLRAPAKTRAPAEESAPAAAPVTKDAARAATSEGKTSLRPRRRRKRVRIGDALRREGLDERTVAETYAREVEKLKNKKGEDGIEKLLFDILKECTRHLESSRPTERSGASDTPVTVQLVHVVPRPERPPAGEGTGEVASG